MCTHSQVDPSGGRCQQIVSLNWADPGGNVNTRLPRRQPRGLHSSPCVCCSLENLTGPDSCRVCRKASRLDHFRCSSDLTRLITWQSSPGCRFALIQFNEVLTHIWRVRKIRIKYNATASVNAARLGRNPARIGRTTGRCVAAGAMLAGRGTSGSGAGRDRGSRLCEAPRRPAPGGQVCATPG